MNRHPFSDYMRSIFNLHTLCINKQLFKMCSSVCAAFFLTQNVCNTINILTKLTLAAKINWLQKGVLISIILSSNLIFSSPTLLGMNPRHRHHLKAFLTCDYNCNCGFSFVIIKFSFRLFPLELTRCQILMPAVTKPAQATPSGRHSCTLLPAA